MLRALARLLSRSLIGLLTIVVVLAAGTYLYMRSSLPEYDGTRLVKGLISPVEIARDRNAVPHIFARSLEDAFYGLGFVHAQDRLWQMEVMRRLGAGRLSELLPANIAGTPFLQIDKLMRTLGIYHRAQDSLAALSPETRRLLEAYAKGVNAWIDTHRGALPPEFVLLQIAPEHWKPVDSLLWGKIMALSLDGNWRGELMRARLLKKLKPEQIADLYPGYPANGPVTLAAAQQALLNLPLDRIFKATDTPFTRKTMASNEWVVGPMRSVAGKPLLANDPHLGFEIPNIFYLARLVGPDFDIVGATVPGVPGVVLGHNKSIAWGFTTTNLDSQDLFIEKIDPTNPNRYVTPDGSQPFGLREETIKVRGGADVKLRVRETRHGPVISDLVGDASGMPEAGHVLALSATALDGADTSAEALLGINMAHDWHSFENALRKYVAPMQNMVYADVEGNIGFIAPGHVPLRRSGDGWMPAPGWSGEYDWSGFVPFEALPRGLNPASGRFVNSNGRIVPPTYPYFITRDWGEPYRQERADLLLTLTPRHTADSMSAIQADVVSPDTQDMLPLLLQAKAHHPLAQAAMDALRLWDGRMLRDRPEPLIYAAWVRALHRALYADELGEDLFAAVRTDEVKVPLHMLTQARQWCDNVNTPQVETCEETMGAALDAALTELEADYGSNLSRWRWGDAHFALFRHRLLGALPIIGPLADRRVAVDGGFYTLNRAATSPRTQGAPFAAIHGPTLRAVYDLEDLDLSTFMMPMGQSGNPLSPHYSDMLENWREFRPITIYGRPDDVARQASGILWLWPN